VVAEPAGAAVSGAPGSPENGPNHGLRPRWTKLVLVFGAATTAEILQFFGVYALGKTFDPLDVVAYATGALIAVAVERAVFAKYLRSWRL